MKKQGGKTPKEVGQHSLDVSGANDMERNGLDSPRQLVYSKEELVALRPRTTRGARFKGEGLPHGFYSKEALQPVVLSGPMPPLRNVHPPARKDREMKPFGRGRREDMEGFGGPVPSAYRQQGAFGGFAGRGGPISYGGGRGGAVGPPWGRGYPSMQQVDCWYYKDAIGNVQGPCNVVKLMEWHKAGLFTANMQVRHVDSTEYIALCDAVDLRTGETKVLPVRRAPQENDSLEVGPPPAKDDMDPLASLSRDTAQLEKLVEEERLRLRQQRSLTDAAPDKRPPPMINEPVKAAAADPRRAADGNGPISKLPFGSEADRMASQFQTLRVSTAPQAPAPASSAQAALSPVPSPGPAHSSAATSAPPSALQAPPNSFSTLPAAGRGFGRGIPRNAPGPPPGARPQDFPVKIVAPGILTSNDAPPSSSPAPPATSDLSHERDPAIVGMGSQINVGACFGLMGLPPPESLGLPPDTPPDIVKAAIVAGMRPVQPVMPPQPAGAPGTTPSVATKEVQQPSVNFAWQIPTPGATRMVAVPSNQLELVDIDPMKEFSSPADQVHAGDAMGAWPKLNSRNEEARQLEERKMAEEASRREELRRYEEAQRAERMMEERRAEEARARMEAQKREEEAKRMAQARLEQQESEREMMRQKRELERPAPAVGRGRGRGFAPPGEGNSVHAQTARLKALAEAKALAALEAEAQMKEEVSPKSNDGSRKPPAPAPSQAPWAAVQQQKQKQVKSMQEVMEEEEREARKRLQEEERQRKLQAEARKNEAELGVGAAWGGAPKPPSLQEVMEEEEREAKRRKEEQERQRRLQTEARKNEPELGVGGAWGGAPKPPSLQEVMEEEARAASKGSKQPHQSSQGDFPSLGSSWGHAGTSPPVQEKQKGGTKGSGAMAKTEQAAAAADLSQSNSAHAQVARMRAQADAKALEEVMRSQEEEKQRALKAKKQQEAANNARAQASKQESGGWSKGGGKNRPLSLAEIQEQELREKQERMARKQAEAQEVLRSQTTSSQAASAGAWAKGAAPVKSLAQIQEEEAARAQREAELLRKRKEEEAVGSGSISFTSGAWASKAAAPPAVEQTSSGVGSAWGSKAGGGRPSAAPAPASSGSNQQGRGKQEEEDEDEDLFWDFKGKTEKQATASKEGVKEGVKGKGGKGKGGEDGFSKWCFKELEKLTGSDDTTLGEFLMSLHSSADVQEYVEEYLGAKGRSFAEEFVLRKQMDSVEVVSSRGDVNAQVKKKKK